MTISSGADFFVVEAKGRSPQAEWSGPLRTNSGYVIPQGSAISGEGGGR